MTIRRSRSDASQRDRISVSSSSQSLHQSNYEGREHYGFGLAWNKGTLTLTDGTVRVFSVSGLGIQGNEGNLVDLEAKGEVYQLQRLEDFTGTYRRTIGELGPDRDTNTVIISNQHGVVVVVTVSVDRAKGNIRLVPSQSGVTVTLEH
jgi:hypothetical protein